MTVWKQNFESQQCVQLAKDCLQAWESLNAEGVSEGELENHSRAGKVLRALEARFAGLDPELFPQNLWGTFSSRLQNAQSQLREFGQSRNPTSLAQANTHLDELLAILRIGDATQPNEVLDSLREAANDFQQKILNEFERVRGRGAEVKAQFDSLANDVAQGKTRLDQNEQIIEQQKARLDQSIAEFQRQFSQAEATRTTDSANAQRKAADESTALAKSVEAAFKQTTEQQKAEHAALIEAAKQDNAKHLAFLEERQTKVNEIFGAIGASSLSGHFKQSADTDAKAANMWRWIALGLMVAMVGVGATAFIYSLQHPELDWKVFAFRLGTTVIIAFPALYAAQESARHRERERRNRKVHLELASIDAYLVVLPEAKRHELKEKLTERFFGREDAVDKDEPVSKHALFELISTLLNNVTKGK